MTYEQKYGRLPDGLTDLETPPEDWQFENPIASGVVGGEAKVRNLFERPKAALPKRKPIAEFLKTLDNKEVDKMDFIKLDMDKQVKMVAEAHNEGLGPTEVQRKLGIKGAGTYYDRLKKAKERGLVGGEKQETPAQAEEKKPDISITPELFKRQAESRRIKAEDLTSEAEMLEQAGMIANALTELLGESAQELIDGLYVRVS